jgi:hypothetical protein
MGNVNGKSFVVTEHTACASTCATSYILGPIEIMHLDYFSVTCITSATQVVAYSVQLSPFKDYGYATAGANFTATSVPAASGADAIVSNKILDNHHAFLKIESSAANATTKGDVRFVIHGVRH